MLEEIIGYGSSNLEIKIGVIKIMFIFICAYYTNFRIVNREFKLNVSNISNIIIILSCSLFCSIARYKTNYLISVISWILFTTILFQRNNIKQSILVTMFSLSMNYIISAISVAIDFIINVIFGINQNIINLCIILTIHLFILYKVLNIKRFKYGIFSLKNDIPNENIDILILTISTMVLFSCIVIINSNLMLANSMIIAFFISAIVMIIVIQKSLQLYYKQKMLIKDLKETKEELENKKKEIAELEAENIRISKKRHTIVHKQKSLEYKLSELLTKTEISTEDATEIKERLEKLKNDIYDEKEIIELDKTGVTIIDDMLKCMQAECQKYKIEFTLVLKGNIHYMINNLISKEELETLLADHIKDAIIAVNHTDNINKSILVKLGNIDGIYGLYIYDSGVEFKKETLDNLGKKPVTTYSTEGGTGMGFMNTFDTLRKHKASLIIEEIGKPSVENYTKVLMIKFDGKNEFLVNSYEECK